jgi:hypothetical protein
MIDSRQFATITVSETLRILSLVYRSTISNQTAKIAGYCYAGFSHSWWKDHHVVLFASC